jgi:hypothetical protein
MGEESGQEEAFRRRNVAAIFSHDLEGALSLAASASATCSGYWLTERALPAVREGRGSVSGKRSGKHSVAFSTRSRTGSLFLASPTSKRRNVL